LQNTCSYIIYKNIFVLICLQELIAIKKERTVLNETIQSQQSSLATVTQERDELKTQTEVLKQQVSIYTEIYNETAYVTCIYIIIIINVQLYYSYLILGTNVPRGF